MPITLPLLPLGSWFPQGNWPRLPCGECSTGELQIGKPTEIDIAAGYQDHEGWEPEWIHGHFTVQAECSNRSCRSIALVAGKMKVDADVDEGGHWYGEYDTFYELRYCDPPLRLLTVPDGTPEDVKRAIESASQVVWMDPSSAANRLRASIEYLLTDLGVPKRGTTHTRIQRLAASRQDVATVLEAVKWIGNDGSHTAALPLKDVLEGVALLERALHLVYDRTAEELDQLADEINLRNRNRGQQTAPRSTSQTPDK
ncbi:MAG: DUF4145 domain-containing protein [Ilumatobacter sp.]|uniref:DUF4145 domain-containing protein n=1 Tax=Ilumatobacter sp. TaxID=1967498 RepID=UPI00391D31AC